jgi:hypothetical protein
MANFFKSKVSLVSLFFIIQGLLVMPLQSATFPDKPEGRIKLFCWDISDRQTDDIRKVNPQFKDKGRYKGQLDIDLSEGRMYLRGPLDYYKGPSGGHEAWAGVTYEVIKHSRTWHTDNGWIFGLDADNNTILGISRETGHAVETSIARTSRDGGVSYNYDWDGGNLLCELKSGLF